MQIKSIAKTLIAGCAIGILAGCGVPQEEVDAMVAKLNADHEAVVTDLKTKQADTDSLLNAEKERTRTLNNDLRDSTALNDELKENVKELKSSLATANSQVSSLESQLASAKASIKSAQDMAADAQNDASTARMEAQETQRRFDELIANLIALNKIKPEDVGFDNLSVSSAPAMDMGGMEMGESSGAGSSSAADLLEQMGNM
jgi:predicted RNase H-like nuclease (RuvC/YqgF family)